MAGLTAAAIVTASASAPAAVLDPRLARLAVASAVDVEAMPVGPDLQLPLILKVLTYDRNFDRYVRTGFHIGIVLGGGDPGAVKAGNDIARVFRTLADKTLRGLPIAYSTLEYTSDSQVELALTSGQFDMLYIAPGNAANLTKLLQVCQRQRIITSTGVPEYVARGVAVGIGIRQDRSEILINLPSSKSAGSEFHASLLRIARVVK